MLPTFIPLLPMIPKTTPITTDLHRNLHARDITEIPISHVEIHKFDPLRGFNDEIRAMPARFRPLHPPSSPTSSPPMTPQTTLQSQPISTAISMREITRRCRCLASRSITPIPSADLMTKLARSPRDFDRYISPHFRIDEPRLKAHTFAPTCRPPKVKTLKRAQSLPLTPKPPFFSDLTPYSKCPRDTHTSCPELS